mmetsp:Transcript_7992/g.10627  ORF Transcript_7992/g.10627 Transcript_7992/m.10627 type:complete len:211 (+) Transcript_7992:995-1627(+)
MLTQASFVHALCRGKNLKKIEIMRMKKEVADGEKTGEQAVPELGGQVQVADVEAGPTLAPRPIPAAPAGRGPILAPPLIIPMTIAGTTTSTPGKGVEAGERGKGGIRRTGTIGGVLGWQEVTSMKGGGASLTPVTARGTGTMKIRLTANAEGGLTGMTAHLHPERRVRSWVHLHCPVWCGRTLPKKCQNRLPSHRSRKKTWIRYRRLVQS